MKPVLLFLAPVVLAAAPSPSLRPAGLRCEYRVNPLGIDVTSPRLSWLSTAISPAAHDLKQTAYRILVASSPQLLDRANGDLWDSGKVAGDESAHVAYGGKPLGSGTQAFWKLQVWDQDGHPSDWSESAHWSMGLLEPSDWKGKWIGREEQTLYKDPDSPLQNLVGAHWIWISTSGKREFRKRFALSPDRAIRRAVIVMGADPGFELTFNGQKLGRGNGVPMPDTFDVTAQIKAGDNTIDIAASEPKPGKPAGVIGGVRVDFTKGDPLVLQTDSTWENAKEIGTYGMAPWGELGFAEERALPSRMLRKEFQAAKAVRRATAYVSGLGLFDLYLNGARIGDAVLQPGLTDYDKHVQYVTFDVTPQIRSGANALGVVLGNGRYWAPRAEVPMPSRSFGYPKLLMQVELEYVDGSRDVVATDESWRLTVDGPIRANNEYDGERYDATREQKGWSSPGFDDSSWQQAQSVAPPEGTLVAQMAEPLRVMETLQPKSVNEIRSGVFIYDLAQNMVGWCRLHVKGPRGTQVQLRHAESLRPDGTLYVENLRSARATDHYTLRGEGVETWEPSFTYHGFRYVEVTGWPGKPPLDAIEGRVVHDAMSRAGEWTSSNSLLNRIQKNIYWGIRGNYRSIPTDCPQRDERQGWLGDRSVVSRSESYMFDIAALYTKWERDLADSQRDGAIPDVSPNYWVLYTNDVTWPSTFILVPDMLYDQYGDKRVIERAYPEMKLWIEHMRTYLKDGLMPRDTFGDWCVPPESPELIHSQDPARKTDGTLLGTAYYYAMLQRMIRYARLIGRTSDIGEYETLASTVGEAFNRKFFNAETGLYGNGTQTASILPLAFGLVPKDSREKLFANLIHRIETESSGHVGTGLVGAQWLMRTLSDNGRPDVAYQIATQTSYPGWGYMVEKGATTVWELWNGDTADPAMNSGNHVMQIGDLNVWLYEYLAGIRPDPEHPGFKHVIIRPYPVDGLDWVKATHHSMYGEIASHWQRRAGKFTLDVTIPPNTTATVYVPTKDGTPAVHECGSGSHHFSSEL